MRHTRFRSKEGGPGVSLCPYHAGRVPLLVVLAAALSLPSAAQTVVLSTPRDLLRADPIAFADSLDTGRPASLSPKEKVRVLRSLPSDGEVSDLDGGSRQKLVYLAELLRATHRESVYEIKVIDLPQALVGIHARAVVLITKPALALLTADELQALVAHEIGHEYVWTQRERAFADRNHARLREVELLCDAIAIVTLHRLGMDSSALMSGIEKISRFNRERFGAARNEDAYPKLSDRRRFADAVRSWTANVQPAP